MNTRNRTHFLDRARRFGFLPLLTLISIGGWTLSAQAEGSRTLYPVGATGNRANLEWRTNYYGSDPLTRIRRRTLLKVYAQQGEHILLGSSAVGVASGSNSGDILVFNPGRVTGRVGDETIPATADFQCSSQAGRGQITSRAQELAGPQSISGTGNTTGYVPCYYQAPTTGVYDVVIYGPSGTSSTSDGTVSGEINLTSPGNFSASQGSAVAAWDVTVRSSDPNSIQDINGRLFTYYFALFAGGNGRLLYFPVYPVTNDGYQYRITLRGVDPAGFVLYGNQVGFFNSDGQTPLYHNLLGQDGQISNPEGGARFAPPQFATFVNPLDPIVLSSIVRYDTSGNANGIGVPAIPVPPGVNSLSFSGTIGNNTSRVNQGGTFSFNSAAAGNYEIIISRDGINFDPTNLNNRVLRGVMTNSGAQTVTWDGKDNSGNAFPVGDNYPAKVQVRAGEYHFPLLDVENNFFGGPTIELLNAANPLGNTTGFYDDRGYITLNGTSVGTPGSVLCGINPPTIPNSNPITGFDTTTNQRAFGQNGTSGNTNVKCTGSFGDTKGLDMWTFFPSTDSTTTVNIVPIAPRIRLVKRITQTQGTILSDYIDLVTGTGASDDNAPSWANPTATATRSDGSGTTPNFSALLQGIVDANTLPPAQQPKPGDSVEYTIYFLADGGQDAQNLAICDFIPANTTYIPGTLQLAIGTGSPTSITDSLADSDGGFYSTGFPTACTGTNNSQGAVVVNVGSVLGATGAGTPTGSYGFIRFQVRVR